MPIRVQRKRTKGYKLPPNTVCVTRPGKFGNPFDTASEFSEAVECCSELKAIPPWIDREKGERIIWIIEHMDELKGRNLACYCPLDRRCHADMLLIWANCEAVESLSPKLEKQ